MSLMILGDGPHSLPTAWESAMASHFPFLTFSLMCLVQCSFWSSIYPRYFVSVVYSRFMPPIFRGGSFCGLYFLWKTIAVVFSGLNWRPFCSPQSFALFSIGCVSSTKVLRHGPWINRAASSANPMHLCGPLFRSSNRSSKTKLKIIGESTPPWLTPLEGKQVWVCIRSLLDTDRVLK